MVLERDDHLMQRTEDNGLIERDSVTIDGSSEISPRELIDKLFDEIVRLVVELS